MESKDTDVLTIITVDKKHSSVSESASGCVSVGARSGRCQLRRFTTRLSVTSLPGQLTWPTKTTASRHWTSLFVVCSEQETDWWLRPVTRQLPVHWHAKVRKERFLCKFRFIMEYFNSLCSFDGTTATHSRIFQLLLLYLFVTIEKANAVQKCAISAFYVFYAQILCMS